MPPHVDSEKGEDDREGVDALEVEGLPLLARKESDVGEPPGRAKRLRRLLSSYTLRSEAGLDGGGLEAYAHESLRLLELALPLALSQFLGFALSMLAVMFIGRLGELQMSMAVLATSFMNVTGYSVLVGFVGALETLCGQAYGAGNYRAVGVALQRALALTGLLAVAVCVVWTQADVLLRALGQDAAIADGSARFLTLAIPAMLGMAAFECLKRYLMAQNVVNPCTVVSLVGVAAAPLAYWLLVFQAGLQLSGAALAQDAVQLGMLVLLGGYIVRRDARARGNPQATWHGWSGEALTGWGSFMSLALPSAAMTSIEWWCYELQIIMAGWLPQPALHVAVMGVGMNISGLLYMMPMGLSCAASVRVSNALGANAPLAARRAAYTALGLVIVSQAGLVVAILLARAHLARLFTNVDEVVATCAQIFPLLAATLMGDGVNAALSGLLRGAGRQQLGALLSLGTYWGLGLPTSYLLAFKAGLGIQGLWAGLVFATTLQGMVMVFVMLRFDWAAEAAKAQERLAEMGVEGDGAGSVANGSGVSGSNGAAKNDSADARLGSVAEEGHTGRNGRHAAHAHE